MHRMRLCCGNIHGQQIDEEEKSNQLIDLELKEEKKKAPQVVLLLLGTGESGKSTFFKQMKCKFISLRCYCMQ